MMILSPAITLQSSPAPQHGKPARDIFVGSLLVFAGLGLLALAASRQASLH